MSSADKPSHEHQVGITNAQEQNPDAEIARLTAEMNALFAAKQYAEAAHIALSITALNKGGTIGGAPVDCGRSAGSHSDWHTGSTVKPGDHRPTTRGLRQVLALVSKAGAPSTA